LAIDSYGQISSGLIGTVYRHKEELTQLNNYSEFGSTLIEKRNIDSSEHVVVWLRDTLTKKQLLILEKIVYSDTSQTKPNYLILDTMSVQFESENNWLSICDCYHENVFNPEIIALVNRRSNTAYFTRIKKVWIADISLGKIILIKKIKGIKCVNQEFSVDDVESK
jgi:hypothetical protein